MVSGEDGGHWASGKKSSDSEGPAEASGRPGSRRGPRGTALGASGPVLSKIEILWRNWERGYRPESWTLGSIFHRLQLHRFSVALLSMKELWKRTHNILGSLLSPGNPALRNLSYGKKEFNGANKDVNSSSSCDGKKLKRCP